MSHARRVAAVERLLAAAGCRGACRRCCRPQGPGHLTPEEQRAALGRMLTEAGVALVPAAGLPLTPAERYGP